jgi:hypothetical protein
MYFILFAWPGADIVNIFERLATIAGCGDYTRMAK